MKKHISRVQGLFNFNSKKIDSNFELIYFNSEYFFAISITSFRVSILNSLSLIF
jgi:hypothetical protein